MSDDVERQCPACGVVYHANAARLKLGRQTTCSRACSYRLRADGLKKQEELTCGGCGKRFLRTRTHIKGKHGNFCGRDCAYANRTRVVEKPYNRTAVVDYSAASRRAWATRRRNPKPYPDAARVKAAARAVERIQKGGGVSAFEKEAADVFRALGFDLLTSEAVRTRGRFVAVFDIVILARRIVVECHGTYWHGGRWTWDSPDEVQIKNLAYEERKAILAREMGIDLRILWEHEFKKDPRGACLAVVR